MNSHEARLKFVAPVERAARNLFSTPDGKVVLDALDEVCSELIAKVPATGAIDVNAVLINVGALRVVQYLRDLAKPPGEGQDR